MLGFLLPAITLLIDLRIIIQPCAQFSFLTIQK